MVQSMLVVLAALLSSALAAFASMLQHTQNNALWRPPLLVGWLHEAAALDLHSQALLHASC